MDGRTLLIEVSLAVFLNEGGGGLTTLVDLPSSGFPCVVLVLGLPLRGIGSCCFALALLPFLFSEVLGMSSCFVVVPDWARGFSRLSWTCATGEFQVFSCVD